MTRLVASMFIAAVTVALAFTARWWLRPLLDLVGAKSDLIQGLEALAQLVLLPDTVLLLHGKRGSTLRSACAPWSSLGMEEVF